MPHSSDLEWVIFRRYVLLSSIEQGYEKKYDIKENKKRNGRKEKKERNQKENKKVDG